MYAVEVRRILSEAELDALSDAFDIVGDQLLEEIADRMADAPDATSPSAFLGHFSGIHLPARYSDSYNVALLRGMFICLVSAAERISEPLAPLRCRAEELTLRAVIEMAITEWEEMGYEEAHSFEDLLDVCFADLDHEYVFDEAFDGIDDPETYGGSQMGVTGLHPSKWFEAFDSHLPVHPMVAR